MWAMEINLETTWKSVMAGLKLSVSEGIFNTYLRQTSLNQITDAGDMRLVCQINCSSAMIRDTLEKRYWGQISQALQNLTGKECELVFSVQGRRVEEQESVSSGPLFEEKTVSADVLRQTRLKSHLTFENYAVGTSNQMAYAAASAVSKNPGQAYNPLFIYGGVGVGKTHLMQAIGLAVLNGGEDRVLFCTSEEFTNDLVEGIRNKSTDRVRNKYRRLKLLLIDDIQFIAGRATVQEEFFHTFNALLSESSQIVMTSDRPPSEISKLEERLRSRFGAGMVVDIGPADEELRTAILLIKSRQKNIDLPIELAKLIARHLTGLRELEGFLVRLSSEAQLGNTNPSVELVEKLLKVSPSTSGQARIVTVVEVINLISNYFGVGVQQLKGDRRTKSLAWPRQVLMHLLRTDLKLPFDEVGRLIGGRDHTTVMHANSKVLQEEASNPSFQAQLLSLRKQLFINSGQAG